MKLTNVREGVSHGGDWVSIRPLERETGGSNGILITIIRPLSAARMFITVLYSHFN